MGECGGKARVTGRFGREMGMGMSGDFDRTVDGSVEFWS